MASEPPAGQPPQRTGSSGDGRNAPEAAQPVCLRERQTPTFQQERESAKTQRLIRSLNNPPEGEILSGQALNDILADIAATDQPAARGPAAKIDADLLGHINLTSNRGAATAGLFKNDARLTWPSALLDEGSKADRDLVDSLASTARRQALDGRVDAGSLRELVAASRRLRQKLAAEVKNLTATQYIDASRFLGQLDDAIRVLSRPDAGDYITGKNTAVGKDVAELVVFHDRQGAAVRTGFARRRGCLPRPAPRPGRL